MSVVTVRVQHNYPIKQHDRNKTAYQSRSQSHRAECFFFFLGMSMCLSLDLILYMPNRIKPERNMGGPYIRRAMERFSSSYNIMGKLASLLKQKWKCTLSHWILNQTSHMTMGKSTWRRGWSSLMIPYRGREKELKQSVCVCLHRFYAFFVTWGIRFFWILFSLALFLPFFVTTASS